MKLLAGVPFFEFRRSDKILLYSRERRTALLFHGLVNAGDGALATAIEAVFQRSAFLNHLFAREPVLPKLTTRSAYLAANVEIELNDACQLGCIYCFSEASACKGSMSRERANAAIDLAFRNAVAQRAVTGTAPIVQLGFTGGGDPFFDPKLALACFEHAKEMSERHDVDYSLSLQTNGQWSPGLAKRLPRYKIGTVCLSMDGLQGVQDLQRPRRDGASSFDRCRRTLDELLECGIAVSIRCTITARSAGSLPYFAALLNRAYPNVTSLSVDSIALSGRAREGKLERVSPDAFSAAIRNARFAAAGRIAIVTHLARLDRFGYYCAPADLLSTIFVSPDERIFSCQERPEAQSRHSKDNPFVIGRFNAEGKPVVGRFESMSRMHIALGNENCRNCVALYYCAGGCKSRISFDEDGCISDEESQYWCSLTQAVSAEEMWSYASDELLYPQAKREFIQIKPDISVAIATLGM